MWWNREELIRSLSWNSQSVGQKNWAFKIIESVQVRDQEYGETVPVNACWKQKNPQGFVVGRGCLSACSGNKFETELYMWMQGTS